MDMLYLLSPLIAITCIWLWSTLRWPRSAYADEGRLTWSGCDSGFLWRLGISSAGSVFLLILAIITLVIRDDGMAVRNVTGILAVLAGLQLARHLLEKQEAWGKGRAPAQKLILDSFNNVSLFLTCYAATSDNAHTGLIVTGILLAAANLARPVKYRLVDDLNKHQVHEAGTTRYRPIEGSGFQHALLRGALDHFLRLYLYTAFSFTIFQMMLMTCLAPQQCSFQISWRTVHPNRHARRHQRIAPRSH